MERRLLLALALGAATLATDAEAQDVRVYGQAPARAFGYSLGDDNRAVIGVSTSTGSPRDTLGVLVTAVTPGGPAERAGIEEGNRIASVNGVNLRLAAADTGDWEMSSAMSRRLTRELGKLKPGDEADLRIYSGGQVRSVKVKTVSSDSLYRTTRRATRVERDERAALGVSLGGASSKRDTLGVLVLGVDDEGPAGKAGIEEGNRIASINGVDLRVSRDDAGDEYISNVKASRLYRELEKVKAGDEVSLRIYTGGGRFRDLRVKTVRMSELPRRRAMFFGGGGPGTTIVTPMPPRPPMDDEIERRLEEELSRAGRVMERVMPAIRGRVTRVSM